MVKRNFNISQPDRVWVTDITCVRTWEGWLDSKSKTHENVYNAAWANTIGDEVWKTLQERAFTLIWYTP